MNQLRTFFSAAAIVAFAAALSGCAVFGICATDSCAKDAQINKQVRELVDQHHEFGPAGTVHVQTINGVVYLTGAVDSEFEVRNAEALVRQVPDVKDVENNLNPRSNSR
jgi:osmotically-inducible protein OsmY